MRILVADGLEKVPGLLEGRSKNIGMNTNPVHGGKITLEHIKHTSNKYFIHGHVKAKFAEFVVQRLRCTVHHVIRDPRNVLISYSRYRNKTPEIMLTKRWYGPFVQFCRGFVGWEQYATIYKYEDIWGHAAYLPGNLYVGAKNDLDTWTGAPSDWREWWTDEIDKIWCDQGGPELVRELGYE